MPPKLFVVHGDSTSVLREFPDASVDAVVTDPNYGMHEYPLDEVCECIVAWATGQPWTPKPRPGFLGKEWDTWVPGPDVWRECLRILKPGGHLLSFAAPRTIDLAMLAVRLAGFEIRDEFNWIYGQGYPKSFNVEKALRAAGLTDEADRLADTGTGLKPAHEPIICARKPLIGTVVENVLAFDTGVLNIGATRIPGTDEAYEKNFSGARGHAENRGRSMDDFQMTAGMTPAPGGRWPANVLFDEAAALLLDQQSGILKSGIMRAGLPRHSDGGYKGGFGDVATTYERGGDSGGASRFFYVAKATQRERNAGLAHKNEHVTVKPIELMRYLIKLVARPGALVLDPFCGSGSTGAAAALEDCNFIGIEREDASVNDARERIAYWGYTVEDGPVAFDDVEGIP